MYYFQHRAGAVRLPGAVPRPPGGDRLFAGLPVEAAGAQGARGDDGDAQAHQPAAAQHPTGARRQVLPRGGPAAVGGEQVRVAWGQAGM